jgi:hypothetical protein
MNQEEQTDALSLAKDLLADIELSRLGLGQMVNKARRLARLVNDSANGQWIEWEATGYSLPDDTNNYSLVLSNRLWTRNVGKDAEPANLLSSAAVVEPMPLS